MGSTELAADVGNHFGQFRLGENAVLNGLRETGDGPHRVDDLAACLCRVVGVLCVELDNVPQARNFAGSPGYAFFDFRLGVAHDIQKNCAQCSGCFCTASLSYRSNRTDTGGKLVHADVHLRGDGGDDAHALGYALDGSCKFVVDLVHSVEDCAQFFHVSAILIRRVHRQKELLCHVCRSVAHDLRLFRKLGKVGGNLLVTGSRKGCDGGSVVCRACAVLGGHSVGLAFHSLHLRRVEARDLADGDKLIVHSLQRFKRFLEPVCDCPDSGIDGPVSRHTGEE